MQRWLLDNWHCLNSIDLFNHKHTNHLVLIDLTLSCKHSARPDCDCALRHACLQSKDSLYEPNKPLTHHNGYLQVIKASESFYTSPLPFSETTTLCSWRPSPNCGRGRQVCYLHYHSSSLAFTAHDTQFTSNYQLLTNPSPPSPISDLN